MKEKVLLYITNILLLVLSCVIFLLMVMLIHKVSLLFGSYSLIVKCILFFSACCFIGWLNDWGLK